ncbi:mechanosensitive ion channel family protein [Mucilaginibacter flavus]|uniref:mechanosensitive ion channel family protein n=1 Tax=Mucilaginibacter flavus TaxID=931504 RepID=UPI0025B37C29|nr:mechanosensitive ion channel domain-containing protein [Mucilaginibacter flavus]MDN3580106.1 mechanosensitive ion channel [Mucilaginibacter flavus]
MSERLKLLIIFIVGLFLLLPPQNSFAQTKKKKGHHTLRDSLREKVLQRDSVIRSFKHSDGSVNVLLGKIEDYTSTYVETNSDLARGFDTLDISQQLPTLEKRMALMRKAIDNSTTMGFLVSIRGMVDHLKDQLNSWEDQLTAYNNQLDKIHSDIADFKKDTVLRTAPADSSLRLKSFIQVQSLERKWKSLDDSTEKAIIKIGLLENRVSSLTILLIDVDDRIDLKIHDFTLKAMDNEYGYIWNIHKEGSKQRLDTALVRSYKLNSRLFRYFLTNQSNYKGHFITIFLLLAFLGWLINSRRKVAKTGNVHQKIVDETSYVVKHPYLSAIMVISVLAPFFYDHATQVFLHIMLLITTGMIGFLIKDVWPKPLYKFWTLLLGAAVVFALSSLLILNTDFDRVVLLLLSGYVIFFSVKFAKLLKSSTDIYPPHLRIIIRVFIGLQLVSVLLNVLGRFSLAKIMGVSATLNLCLAMGFYLVVQILMESLFLQLEANKTANSQNFISYIDFKVVQKKFKGVLIKITSVLWLLALAKNLTIDDYLYDTINDFLNHPYQISSTAFTFRSVLVFIIVIWLSGLLARVISYFYDFAGQQTKLTPQAKKTRSSILLIRLTVFVVGFFVAITAAGIPMDRVTIIIGALGVGIGFGLQNIVNNLVSGVILAFEKPVQVGDIIEVSGKSGTIKEIGIRSSKIECGDGSELIVPNGDLISQHVVNWTLTDNNRRVELIIRVVYGSDVVKVEDLLSSIVNEHADIMKSPSPAIFLNNFSDAAVEFRVLFWAADINRWSRLKSDVMREIYLAFNKEGIEIAQSQKEIQLLFPENGIAEAKAIAAAKNQLPDTPSAAQPE